MSGEWDSLTSESSTEDEPGSQARPLSPRSSGSLGVLQRLDLPREGTLIGGSDREPKEVTDLASGQFAACDVDQVVVSQVVLHSDPAVRPVLLQVHQSPVGRLSDHQQGPGLPFLVTLQRADGREG